MKWSLLSAWVRQLMRCRDAGEINANLGPSLKLLKADAFLLFLYQADGLSRYCFSAGLSADSHCFIATHAEEDIYLQNYLSQGLIGHSAVLQRLPSHQQLEQTEFLHRFAPHFDFNQSLGLILPLGEHWLMGLSCHRHSGCFPKRANEELSVVGAALLPWAQKFVEQQTTTMPSGLILPGEHLTPAESRVMSLLMKGMDGGEISELRGVSHETVKSQIKSLLHKSGCRHQNHLLSKLAGWH
ncbi:helix-turn-helix transcriptional regulator [Shewanella submarina]|uniref:Helix-turn-helix transcriptional regulator n=1 Tax=Shewanella submarina TaxID=2016376 RepID=A0ABV7GLU8_9GAMM|nr:helix-turn-helix transcriptional regulator [Shewanella submarina]MCL1035739.1 helix-turn-helix transcriptional regulator [Shewanella submarina]